MPYTIKADLGIKRGDDLELFDIEGKIKNRDGIALIKISGKNCGINL